MAFLRCLRSLSLLRCELCYLVSAVAPLALRAQTARVLNLSRCSSSSRSPDPPSGCCEYIRAGIVLIGNLMQIVRRGSVTPWDDGAGPYVVLTTFLLWRTSRIPGEQCSIRSGLSTTFIVWNDPLRLDWFDPQRSSREGRGSAA